MRTGGAITLVVALAMGLLLSGSADLQTTVVDDRPLVTGSGDGIIRHATLLKMPINAVPLTMQFCLDCHRDPGARLRPLDQITNMAWKPNGDRDAPGHALLAEYGIRVEQMTYCYVCHR